LWGALEPLLPCTAGDEAMTVRPKSNPVRDAEIEIICARCGYHMPRKAERLRHDTEIVCPNCGEVVLPEGHERGEAEA
jgi:DNA-directed RNA polymerase subunit RPC12/RpoP